MKKHIGVFLGICLSLTFLSVSSVSSAAPQVVGTKCVKVGSFRTAKNVKYRCKKSAQGLRWVAVSAKNKSNETSLTTTVSTTTISAVPLYNDPEITNSNDLLNVQECRIRDATPPNRDRMSLGFPRPNFLRASSGQLEVLVIPVGFTDLPFTARDATAIKTAYEKVHSFYSTMSYGQATVNMTLAPSTSWFDVGLTIDQSRLKSRENYLLVEFYRNVIQTYSRHNSISGYDVVDVVSAYSTSFGDKLGLQSGSEIWWSTRNSFVGTQFLGSYSQKWELVAEMLGHMWLGFEELYLFGGGLPFGKWDLMSVSGTELSGWSRFLAGWIDTKKVRCASRYSKSRHYLTSLNSGLEEDKPQMIIIPLNSFSAVIVELRTPGLFQTDIKKPTVVVYQVNTTKNRMSEQIVTSGVADQIDGIISTLDVKVTVKNINSSGVIIEIGS